jgi:hypothetical protein
VTLRPGQGVVAPDVDLSEYVAAGYWITVPIVRPGWCDPQFVADPVISSSGCLLGGGTGPPVPWGTDVDDYIARLGVASADIARARGWVEDHEADVGFFHTWRSPEPLAEFLERFIPAGAAMIAGLALPAERAHGCEREDDAMVGLLASGQPLAAGGTPLGWEPVEWAQQGICCSWTCNRLQEDVAEQVDLRLTECGLLADQRHADEVMAVVEHLPKEDWGAWEAFLLVRYGPEPRGPFRVLPPAVCALPNSEPAGSSAG